VRAEGDHELPPSFAAVMATGIVSIGARQLSVAVVDIPLLVLNVAAYVVAWLMTGRALARRPAAVLADLADHRRAFGFLTCVAATSVLGAQMVTIAGSVPIATALLILAVLLWLVLSYAVFALLIVTREKPSLAAGIDGGWLLAVVAAQSIAVLTALLSRHWESALRRDADFIALALWLSGGVLYLWIASLIFYRSTFLPFSPADLTPTYWINMGAMAISALAGSLLVEDAGGVPFLASLRPFIEGGAILCWATGTWWTPLLATLVVWRHAIQRLPLGYEPAYWSAVFPLGMYAVATHALASAMSLDFLVVIARACFWIAVGAWLLTAAGFTRRRLHAPARRAS
jgi:tellurite resistance protein TehA-like permease